MFKLLIILLLSCTKQVEIENLVQKTSFNQQQKLSREAVVGIVGNEDALIGSGAYVEHKRKFYVITAAHVVKDEEAIKVVELHKNHLSETRNKLRFLNDKDDFNLITQTL